MFLAMFCIFLIQLPAIMPRKLRFYQNKKWEIQKQAKKQAAKTTQKQRQRENPLVDVRA